MITLVIGGMNSGKSKYAEDIIRTKYKDLKGYYIATMIPYGEFGEEKIAKHRAMRGDLELTTIEDPYLDESLDIISKEANDRRMVLIMEDLSNLIANYMFERKTDYNGAIGRLVSLGEKHELIIVALSLDANDKSQSYDTETINYITEMNKAIERISSVADNVVYMNNLE